MRDVDHGDADITPIVGAPSAQKLKITAHGFGRNLASGQRLGRVAAGNGARFPFGYAILPDTVVYAVFRFDGAAHDAGLRKARQQFRFCFVVQAPAVTARGFHGFGRIVVTLA
ncbi:hypothetical protein D3C86_1698060 [compost metagenome]